MSPNDLTARIDALDWDAIRARTDAEGRAIGGALLDRAECAELAALFDDDARFRSTVDMGPRAYGEGTYRYLTRPLPPLVETLRRELYARLTPLASDWWRRLGREPAFPRDLDAFLARCAEAGQTRPTPLLLRYGPGGHNRLHQDRYGEVSFPLQAAICLNRPGPDFTGGEFLLAEQRARQQTRVEAIALERGELLVFAGGDRPVPGRRGEVRCQTRHGVSRVRSGGRVCLGIIFHDAA